MVLDGDPPAQKEKVNLIFSFLDMMDGIFHLLILTFHHLGAFDWDSMVLAGPGGYKDDGD